MKRESWMLALALVAPPRLPQGTLPVPIVPQATSYSCGSAAVMAVLYYWQVYDGHEVDLWRGLGTTSKEGTDPLRMTAGLKEFHLDALYLEGLTPNDLRKYLNLRYTVIVDYQAWRDKPQGPWTDSWEDGHYSVVVAMDSEFIYVMDPSTPSGYGYIPIGEFVDRWHDYEIRNGVPVRYFHQGIVVRGARPVVTIPAPLTRVQ